jgi:hypothetical protein
MRLKMTVTNVRTAQSRAATQCSTSTSRCLRDTPRLGRGVHNRKSPGEFTKRLMRNRTMQNIAEQMMVAAIDAVRQRVIAEMNAQQPKAVLQRRLLTASQASRVQAAPDMAVPRIAPLSPVDTGGFLSWIRRRAPWHRVAVSSRPPAQGNAHGPGNRHRVRRRV